MSNSDQGKIPSHGRPNEHLRRHSSGELSIEELLPDDMGYDADVEVIKPDKYEEIESESEDAAPTIGNWQSVDEELAARMRRLGRERSHPLRASLDRGRKRRSTEMAEDDDLLSVPMSPDLEVQEVTNDPALPSPAKRRRKKSRRRNAAQHIFRGANEIWTDSSERAYSSGWMLQDGSTSPAPSEKAKARRNEDDEMMDVT